MRAGRQRVVWVAGVAAAAIVFVSGCSDMGARMDRAASTTGLTLTGAQEVPPVNTQASGVSSIAVIGDKTVTGGVQTTNLNATAAHIHMAPAGQNGPVIIPLNKTGDNTWSVPANTILTSAQFDAYRAGNLYVNVHSAANPGGEIRLQLKP
ncbi:MAG TPA: CHRD domain-containing protein [Acidimicrobiales bacterium]|jgi:CHRD domain-containing protein